MEAPKSSNADQQAPAATVKAWSPPMLTPVDLAKVTLAQAGGATDCCLGS